MSQSKSRLELLENPSKRKGLSETLSWRCNLCLHETQCVTSKLCKQKPDKRSPFNINVRSVSIMNFVQPVNKTAYNTTQNKLLDELSVKASKVMTEAAERLYNKVLTEEPNNTVVNNEHGITCEGNGRWYVAKTRSLLQDWCVFVISSLTCEVLDFEVKSLFCHQCKSNKIKYKVNNTLFDQW